MEQEWSSWANIGTPTGSPRSSRASQDCQEDDIQRLGEPPKAEPDAATTRRDSSSSPDTDPLRRKRLVTKHDQHGALCECIDTCMQ